MQKEENLLNDFENKYLKPKKKRHILFITIGIIILIILIIIIFIFIFKNKSEKKSEKNSNPCPKIKSLEGGLSGSGILYRYWNCCKPSCSYTNNAGLGNEARECNANMSIISLKDSKSICEGGPSTTCLSQAPFTIDGCDNMGFGFASVPGDGKKICGRCFLIEFTGEGKDVTRINNKLLKEKKLIVMANNIEYDDTGRLFNFLVPGGGTGINNGCSDVLGDNIGSRNGGLIGDCVFEIGYISDEETLCNKRKECLQKKCNDVFANLTDAKEGCLFFANFLEVVQEPLINYTEIECPKVLKDKY